MLVFKTQAGFIAGAYTQIAFQTRNLIVTDDTAFLFSFNGDQATRWNNTVSNSAVHDHFLRFPSFGTTDLLLPTDLQTQNATSQLGGSFQGSGSMAEANSFKIISIEIFTRTNTSNATCFGKSAMDSTVCSLRGYCIAPNKCQCHNPQQYGGSDCSQPICYNLLSGNSSVCSGMLKFF